MNTKKPVFPTFIFSILLLSVSGSPAIAGDVLSVKDIGMELAQDIATKAVMVCRKKGYQVSAVVVDRSGSVRAALRDDLASRFTLELSERKANTVILSNVASSEMRKNRSDIRPELNHIKGLIILEGGLPITSGGYKIGALGVSGAPGGDIDEDCAKEALESFEDRLEFGAD